MNKLFTKIVGAALGLTMAIGVGVAVASNSKEATPVHATSSPVSYGTATFSAALPSDGYWTGSGGGSYCGGYGKNKSNAWSVTLDFDSATGIDWNTVDFSETVSLTTSVKAAGNSATGNVVLSINNTAAQSNTHAITSDFGSGSNTASTKAVAMNIDSVSSSFSTITINFPAKSFIYQFSCTLTFTEKATSDTLDAITNVSATISATVGDSEWTITNASATGTISGSTGQNVTSLVDFSVTTSVPAVAGNPNVTLRATKKSGVLGDATYYEKTVSATVAENPFASFTKVEDKDDITSDGIYVLSYDGKRFAGNAVSNSGITYPITNINSVGYYKIDSNGYLARVSLVNDVWTISKYLNNSSSTTISESNSGSSVWEATNHTVDDNVVGVYLTNTSNSDRFLGLGTSDASTATIIKAYATSNFVTRNLPIYLYEVPQDKLDGLTVSGQTTTFTAGSTFSLGNNAVLTAHYSDSGNTTDLSGGTLSYKINNVTVTTSTVLDHDTHNGKSVVITYTDAAGDVASTTAYTITVNYKPAGSISLNLDSAPLSIGGSVSLTATVGDEYADENDVSWSTTSAGIASISAAGGTKTITVTGVSAGSATITATANGHSATCAISVTADPILNLKDSGDNIINDETLEFFTGDDSVMIQAVSENVASPVYNWSNEDDSVVTIDVADEYCEVTIVGAGSSEVSVTVGALTRTVTFSIAQSGVTSLTLTSSVPSGALYDGTYNNTLTLTPAVTLVGNATGVINWSSSDTNVATVSNASTTAPTGITVTGVGAGTATITAASVYTPSRTATFDVTVTADGVTALSWTKRPKFNSSATGFQTIWAGETTLGDLMSQNGSDGIGVFAPTWKSSKSDSPTMGTGTHDVHIGLYDAGAPTEETTPLTSSYVFTAADNGKYVVAFYEGKASTNNTQLSVTKWRTVMESSTLTETFDYSAGGANMSQSGDIATASIAKSGSTTNEADSLRLGSGSATGTLTVTSSTNLISKIEVWVKSYGTDSATLNVGSENTGTISADEFESFEFTFDDPVSSVAMSTTASKKRVYVQKVVITSGGLNDIGKSADCLGLEVYIDTYLHMSDYTTSEGWCKDEEHNYYGKNTETGAKYHFNQLNAHQRSLLSSNSAYAAEWARLSAWAAANGESLNSSSILAAARISPLANIVGNTNTIAVIVVISMISITCIGGYFFLRKRKEN